MNCSEIGRAIVSAHSVMIFEAVSASAYESPALSPFGFQYFVDGLAEEARADNGSLYETCLLYADQLKQRRVDQFKEGSPGREQLASVQWGREGCKCNSRHGEKIQVMMGWAGLSFGI